MRNVTREIKDDDKGYFRSPQFGGVALRIVGYPQEWETYEAIEVDAETGEEVAVETNEGEWVDNPDSGRVVIRMVGDDRDHVLERVDLQPLKRREFCGGCGQIGCACDPYDGDDE